MPMSRAPDETDASRIGRRSAETVAREISHAFGDAFEGALLKEKPFKAVFRSLVQDIQSTLLQSVVETSTRALFTTSARDGFLQKTFTSLIEGFSFAEGGVMGPRGPLPLQTYARGGVADSPQVALFGEGRTPEAFVPLPDGRRIPVRMEGAGTGGRGVSIVNNITVHANDAGSFRRAEGQIGAEIAGRLQRHLSRNG